MNGVELIAAEREKQKSQFPSSHDDTHVRGELIYAGIAYALATATMGQGINYHSTKAFIQSMHWPADWGEFFMDEDPIQNLVKAAALIAAEIDRLHRKK